MNLSGKKPPKDNKVEQERNMLKITVEYLAKENENLKRQNEDMKVTVKSNKELLREYIEKITNKDKVVEKMNNTIDQLQTRVQSLEEHIKNSQNINTGSKTIRSMTPMRNNGIVVSNSGNKSIYKLSDNENSHENISAINQEMPDTNDSTRRYSFHKNTQNSRVNTNLDKNTNFNLKPIKPPKVNENKKKIENKIDFSEYLNKQNLLMEELKHLKIELSEFLDKNKIDDSILSNVENDENYQIKINKINLTQKYFNTGLFENLLKNYDMESRDILLFVDSNKNIWELIIRNDLTIENLTNKEKELVSINKILHDLNLSLFIKERIYINNKEVGDISIGDSEIDLSKGSDLEDMSMGIRETINNMSEIN